MKLRVVTLFFDPDVGFDNELLQKAIGDVEILDATDHFYIHGGVPYLTVLIRYRDDEEPKGLARKHRRTFSLKELDEESRSLYEILAKWRRQKAKDAGIPPFMIANNRQLAKIASERPLTKAALRKIEGIGEAKADKYGEEIFEVIRGVQTQEGDETSS